MQTFYIINNRSRRRGVTLLIVLALMVMFAMLVTTFMVITTQNRRTAETFAKILIEEPPSGVFSEKVEPLPRQDWHFDAALRQLLNGSPMSIMENLYGHPNTGPAGHFQVESTTDGTLLLVTIPNLSDYLDRNDLGNVVTVLLPNSPLHLKSTFVFDVLPSEDSILLVPFMGTGLNTVGAQVASLSRVGSQLVFNTPQFSGADVPGYTAPDHRNMFLAWHDVKNGQLEQTIPSFHRSEHVLRPMPTDHPDFTGSNPAATVGNLEHFLAHGPWDVDNTGSGIADGVWLDIGLGVQPDPQRPNSFYKPLVSFHVIDMDGRGNLNTLGNLALCEPPPDLSDMDINLNTGKMGTGMGPAELTSPLLPPEILAGILTGDNKHDGRYGPPHADDNKVKPGDDDLMLNNGINEKAYTDGGLVADWFGYSPIMFDSLGNRVVAVPDTELDNPYLMNPYSRLNGDDPFRMIELESLVRSVMDRDYRTLPQRLRDLLGDVFDPTTLPASALRYSFGTRSSDIPVAPPLYSRVLSLCAGNRTEANKLWMLLPEEIRRGGKVNLNRLTLIPNWETGGANVAEKSALLAAKVQFAQEMFYLLRVLLSDKITSPELLERLAQWSVNLVDFVDPDDVMTPFIYMNDSPRTISAFDNSTLIAKVNEGTLTPADMKNANCTLIWGFEKSEVVLTETLAFHNRGVVAIEDNNGNSSAFRQNIRPQGSLFVKLYRQGNGQRNYSVSSLIDAETGTLDLAQRTTDRANGDFVWRIAIGEAAKTTVAAIEKFTWNEDDYLEKNALRQLLTPDDGKPRYPQFYQWWYKDPDTEGAGEYHPDLGRPERFIWFGRGTLPEPDDSENRLRSFGQHTGGNPNNCILSRDTSLVVAPQERTYLGPPDAPVSINLAGVRTIFAVNLSDAGSSEPGTRLNVSEPLSPTAYPTFTPSVPPTFTDPEPFDGRIAGTIPRLRGTIPCYKTLCLQRLADPSRSYDPICNPYLTVDWNMIDLHVFNSVNRPNQNRRTEESDIPKDEDMHMSSRQWKHTSTGYSNIWDRTLAKNDLVDKAGLERTGYDDSGGEEGGLLVTVPKHTLGQAVPAKPLMHFPWNDAPFMNSGELMLVPTSAPGRFGVEYHDNMSGSFFDTRGMKPRFGYNEVEFCRPYFNDGHFNWGNSESDMQRLFDFVHVPTRFSGTRTDPLETSPVLVYREPGKINLNTLTEEGWNILANGRTGFPSYDKFCEYRDQARDADGPFLSPLAALLGLEGMIDNGASNPYTALENVMRLSDVTTTRSNVFAIWVSIGYFDVERFADRTALLAKYPALTHIDSDVMFKDVYPDGCVLGAERGLDDGTVRRYRAFYLLDRSTPVGYRYDNEMNVRGVILQETQGLD